MSNPAGTQPIQEQPLSVMRLTDMGSEANLETSVPYRSPVILGPIPPSEYKVHVMGPQPIVVICHMCNQKIKTVIFHRAALKTHLVASFLCLAGFICCWCIPYCIKSCNKTDHYCPYCSAFIGSYYID